MIRPSPACAALLLLAACKPAASPADAPRAADQAAPPPATVAAAALPLAAIAAPADAKGTVQASIARFLAVRSYHASMHAEGGAHAMDSDIDFVAPDRYRMAVKGLGTQVVIGDTMYMSVQGRSMQVPMPPGTLTQWRDPARLEANAAGMTVEAQGADPVDGSAAQRYLVHHSDPHPTDLLYWIGADGLPLQIQVHGQAQGKPVTTTIRYSRFDDPAIQVAPPR